MTRKIFFTVPDTSTKCPFINLGVNRRKKSQALDRVCPKNDFPQHTIDAIAGSFISHVPCPKRNKPL